VRLVEPLLPPYPPCRAAGAAQSLTATASPRSSSWLSIDPAFFHEVLAADLPAAQAAALGAA